MLTIRRKLRAVAGELGEVDRAALFEYLRNRTFHYQVFKGETCLVETDEEPPHQMNREALEIALEIALLLNCKIVDEIHVMRKTVIDGSNTSGFQRTALIGMNGWISGPNGKRVGIAHVCLEEESAGIVERRGNEVIYRLDRLAVPLVEISISLLVGFSPKEVQEIAYRIGMLLRSTGKVMRGIGTIRQDVNVSVKGGARVEIKGVQELGLIQRIIENEVKRQLSLLEIKEELKRRGITEVTSKVYDVTGIFKATECKFIKSVVDRGGKVFSIVLKGFDGLLRRELCPGKTLGRELADYAVAYGVKGIVHSDEDL
ncbi:MAG TPA: Glu-tRNA(Gln) amidotransferase subunit GatE, partial [Thermoplasmata archaeon]|nr:Glu-tRNA(Gln) amidotransferase subunit GatE [Thermoplasmata archaeon]